VIKLFAIAFTCVYLHLSVGVVQTTHYCMGRESSKTLLPFQSPKCCCNHFISNLEKKSCCHDHLQILVLDDDQTLTFPLNLSGPSRYLIADLYHSKEIISDVIQVNKIFLAESDTPSLLKEPLYKVLCSYTLYEEERLS
jgi:hypothetical protein